MKPTAKTMAKLLEVSDKSFYRWKNKDHKLLVNLIEQYFTDFEINEFLEEGEIKKFKYDNILSGYFEYAAEKLVRSMYEDFININANPFKYFINILLNNEIIDSFDFYDLYIENIYKNKPDSISTIKLISFIDNLHPNTMEWLINEKKNGFQFILKELYTARDYSNVEEIDFNFVVEFREALESYNVKLNTN